MAFVMRPSAADEDLTLEPLVLLHVGVEARGDLRLERALGVCDLGGRRRSLDGDVEPPSR